MVSTSIKFPKPSLGLSILTLEPIPQSPYCSAPTTVPLSPYLYHRTRTSIPATQVELNLSDFTSLPVPQRFTVADLSG